MQLYVPKRERERKSTSIQGNKSENQFCMCGRCKNTTVNYGGGDKDKNDHINMVGNARNKKQLFFTNLIALNLNISTSVPTNMPEQTNIWP